MRPPTSATATPAPNELEELGKELAQRRDQAQRAIELHQRELDIAHAVNNACIVALESLSGPPKASRATSG